MRLPIFALLIGLAACGAPKQPSEKQGGLAEPAGITFEGATVADAAAKVAHGERLTRVLGCRGCHGNELQGQRFYDRYASNLTRDLPKYTDTQIETVLRTGVPIDGRELWGMPSDIFQHMSGPDMAALIGYLRTLAPTGEPTKAPLPWTKESQEAIAKGDLKPAAVFVREKKDATPADLGPDNALGRYIATVTCAECHGPQLNGYEGFSPDLIVAGGYSRAEFERLITQGVPTGGRKLKNEMMAEVAKGRFSRLSPHERDALYVYLKARAEQPQ